MEMTQQEKDSKRTKKPWPTKEAMEQVYAMNLWGSNESYFYSGQGSHQPELVTPYINAIASFLTSFEYPLVVCDLGCGDFNVGKDLVQHAQKYIAVDIVSDLIAYNRATYINEKLEFHCLDIATNDLPAGDCVLLRQVLQHLSNIEISKIIGKLNAYKYVVLTEHIPSGNFVPNKDIISGQGIRIKKGSGVDLLSPPFNFKVKKETHLLSIVLDDNKGVIITTLFEQC